MIKYRGSYVTRYRFMRNYIGEYIIYETFRVTSKSGWL